jgi:hypothetical protein
MADREAVNGDSHIGVWFFRKSIGLVQSGCPGAGTFSDVHTAGEVPHSSTNSGDILVLADFTNGGANVTIKVFEWVGTGGNDAKSNGALNQIGFSVNCIGLPPHPAGTPELCATSNPIVLGPGNGADNTANTADDGPKWPFPPNNNAYPINAFFEGGIDLNSLGLQGACFGSVLTETRSSDETSAILKDFVISPFEPCSATMDTTPQGPFTFGSPVSDSATVTVNSPTAPAPTGTVDFYICGPSAGLQSCSAATGTKFSTVNLSTATGTPPAYTITSGTTTPGTPGDYCFFATWAGDAHYPGGASHDSANECFTVPKLTPTITTDVHNASHSIITNTSVTQGTVIHDKATVTGSGGGPVPTGSVVFTLYSTIDCTGPARTAPPTNPETVALTVGATNATAESTAWTPAAGVYSYKASYTDDAFYNSATDSACEPLTVINPTTTFNKSASPAVTTIVTYSFAETNDGSVPLNPPTAGDKTSVVQDSQCSSVTYVSGDSASTGTLNVLDPSETWNFTCSKTYTGAGTFTNTATGHGIDPVGKDVTWCADVNNPGATVRCDQDETDTTTVVVTVTTTNGKP